MALQGPTMVPRLRSVLLPGQQEVRINDTSVSAFPFARQLSIDLTKVDFELLSCCSAAQESYLYQVLGFTVAILVLWRTPVLKSAKLMVVFMHEMSHVLACWLTGGVVLGMEGTSIVTARQGIAVAVMRIRVGI
jgi:hypothetical protein